MMPSRDNQNGGNDGMDAEKFVEPDWLVQELKQRECGVLVLDCRAPRDFHESHVREAINVTLPASVIMLRRLANGKLSIPSIIKDPEQLQRFTELSKSGTLVLYDNENSDTRPNGPCVLSTLYRRLVNDDCSVVCLQGGFRAFRERMPEWCECDDGVTVGEESLSLENLRITPLSDSESEKELCDSGLDRDTSPNDPPFPVEILPYLFLGNADNSGDFEALERHKIHYILNVTPNLPNAFEGKGLGFKYMKIPIQDHWSQNLASYFLDAIAFIDEARQKKEGVLVHCLAGISRSVTITLAYLMQKLSMPLNDAYDFVRQRKANISPNFNFMGQLMDFERQLNLTPYPCTCQETPCRCLTLHFISPTHTTPDSGIDIDRWT